jgi:hypothetical protein
MFSADFFYIEMEGHEFVNSKKAFLKQSLKKKRYAQDN